MATRAIRIKEANDKFTGMPPLPRSLPIDWDYDAVYSEWVQIAQAVVKGELVPGCSIYSPKHNFLTAAKIRAACQHPSLPLFTFFVRDLHWHPNQALEDGNVALKYAITPNPSLFTTSKSNH